MVSGSLQAFTNSWQEMRNPKMEEIKREFRDECQPVIDKYINIFSRENIEYYSLNGAFYEKFSPMLLNARLQAMLDLPQEDLKILGEKIHKTNSISIIDVIKCCFYEEDRVKGICPIETRTENRKNRLG